MKRRGLPRAVLALHDHRVDGVGAHGVACFVRVLLGVALLWVQICTSDSKGSRLLFAQQILINMVPLPGDSGWIQRFEEAAGV